MTSRAESGRGVREYESARVRKRTTFALLLGLVGFGGCTDWAGYDLDYLWSAMPVLSTMRNSVTYDPYDLPRLPPENSVPFATGNGSPPPQFAQAQLDSAAATLRNPFAGGGSAAVLARGQFVYATQCVACHGPQGAGNGPVVGPGKFPFAPAINGAATAARSDGYIYGVVAVGRGLMPPYGEKITHTDRWAVVSYLRQLQGQSGAPAPVPGVPTVVNPPDVTPGGQPLTDTSGQQGQ
jgi:mono/diheme cytochrome c family protein